MKRYETFLNKDCGRPFADIEEDANGGLVMYREAQSEIDALKAQRDELLGVLQMVADGCGVLDISERGQLYEAIAKARGDL